MIRTIFFDMYGVIVKESKGNFIPYIFQYFPKQEHERLVRQIKEEQLFTKAGNGEISSEHFLTLLGFKDPQYHMKNYLEKYLTLDEEFITFAEKYSANYNFVLVSNDISEWSAYLTEYYRLNKYFRCKIVSGDVNCRKPDKRIFSIALEGSKSEPQDCIFIDNNINNLDAAAKLGIVPILFDRDKVLYKGLIINSFEELEELLHKR